MEFSLLDWVLVQKLMVKAGALTEDQIVDMSSIVSSSFPNWTWDLTPYDVEDIVALKLQYRVGEVPLDKREAFGDIPGWSWDLTEAEKAVMATK